MDFGHFLGTYFSTFFGILESAFLSNIFCLGWYIASIIVRYQPKQIILQRCGLHHCHQDHHPLFSLRSRTKLITTTAGAWTQPQSWGKFQLSSARNQPDWVDTSPPTPQCHCLAFLTFPPVAHGGGAPVVGDQEPYSPATGFSLLERWGPWAGLVSILGACPRRAKPTPVTPGHTGTHLAKDWAQGQPLLGSRLLGPSKPGPVRLTP